MTLNDADDDRTQSFTLLTKGSAVSHYTIVEKIGEIMVCDQANIDNVDFGTLIEFDASG